MLKKITILLVSTVFILSCQSGSKKKIEEFSNEYTAIQQKYKERQKTLSSQKEYMDMMKERVEDYENLLKKHEKSPAVDEIEILRSKALLQLSKVDKAEEKIDKLLENKTEFSAEVKMLKVQVLLLKKDIEGGHKIFKEVEDKVERGEDLFSAYFYFAMFSEDIKAKEEYSNKFLNAADLPEDLKGFKPQIYMSLADAAKERQDIDKAKEYLKKAMDLVNDPRGKMQFEAQIAALDLIGKPAPAIAPETWVNSPPLALNKLTGKVVVIDFWATWCQPCRAVMPALTKAYDTYEDQGLVIIGFTKLYGNYNDEQGSRGQVSKPEEIALIKEFVKRNKLSYPTAISNEGREFETYKISAIPTMIFIDKQGNIADIEMGAGNPQDIEKRIKKLLEE